MKRIALNISAACISLAAFVGCQEEYITYHDKEYVMFADSVQTHVIREDITSFEIPIASTVACPYDRHFAVEIIDPTTSAIEGRDYVLESNNFTIPAGEMLGYVKVNGNLDNLDQKKEQSFKLKLVVPDDLVMPLYGDQTQVNIKRTCKFNRENFTGWAVVTSMFLYQYSLTGTYQRLVYTSPDPDNETGIIIHDYLADGYDVKINFDDTTDPVNPSITMPSGQVISDEGSVFGMVHGDNHILMEQSVMGPSYFFSCQNVAVLVNRIYVENIGDDVGTVGDFLNELDWVSDAEAERLRVEEGM